MRVMRINRGCFNDGCLILAFSIMLFLIVVVLLFRIGVTSILNDCETDVFINKFCKVVSVKAVQGNACSWICEEDGKKRKYQICSQAGVHNMEDSVFLRSNSGPVFGMNMTFLHNIVRGYTVSSSGQLNGETFHRANSRIRGLLRRELNAYLNAGTHDALLNSLSAPKMEPIPAAYVQSLIDLVKDRRYILSLLFYGSGQRETEVPGSATESIPAVSLQYVCAGLYQTYNLINYTTPLISVLNKPSGSWSLGPTIDVFHLYEVIHHLMDIEETVSEHEYEGQFLMCNFNTSQILLHNDCVKTGQSLNVKLSKPCTLKVLDVSKMIFSKREVERRLSQKSCIKDEECRFHNCQGVCNKATARCEISERTQLAGLLQICQLLKSIDDQLLESVANKTTAGRVYYAVDKCLDLRYYPLDMPDAPQHLIYTYNTVFQELKLLFITLYDIKTFQYKNAVEEAAARKERAKQKKH